MSTTTLAFDGFTQSPHLEFNESPHHERDSNGTLLTYTNAKINEFGAYHGRRSVALVNDVGTPIGAARTALDETFLRRRDIYTATDGTTTWNAEYVAYHYNRYSGNLEADAGTWTGSQPTYSVDSLASSGVTSDTASLVVWEKVENVTIDGVSGTVTLEITYDEAYAHDDCFDDLIAIHSAKYAAWLAAAPSDETWCYNNAGAIVSGYWQSVGIAWPVSPQHAGIAADFGGGYPDGTDPLERFATKASKFKNTTSPTLSTATFVSIQSYIDFEPFCEQPGSPGAKVRVEPIADLAVYTIAPANLTDYHTVNQTAHRRAASLPP